MSTRFSRLADPSTYTPTLASNTTVYRTDSSNGVAISSAKVDLDIVRIIDYLNLIDDDLNSITAAGLPTQTGNSGKYITTNGTTASWSFVAAASLLDTANRLFGTNGSGVGQVVSVASTLSYSGGALGVADGQINTTQLTDGAVTTDKLGAAAVTNAKMAANAITDTEVAAAANITGSKVAAASDSARGTVELATSAEGITGTATDLAMTPAATLAALANYVKLTLVTDVDVTAGATIDVTDLDGDTYLGFVNAMAPDTDDVDLQLLFSVDNGSSFVSSGYAYAGAAFTVSAASAARGSASSAALPLGDPSNGTGNATAESTGVLFVLTGLQSTTKTHRYAVMASQSLDTAALHTYFGTGHSTGTVGNDVDAIRVLFNSGNIATGNFKLFKVG